MEYVYIAFCDEIIFLTFFGHFLTDRQTDRQTLGFIGKLHFQKCMYGLLGGTNLKKPTLITFPVDFFLLPTFTIYRF